MRKLMVALMSMVMMICFMPSIVNADDVTTVAPTDSTLTSGTVGHAKNVIVEPSNARSFKSGYKYVTLKWTKSGNADQFIVYMKSKGGSYHKVATTESAGSASVLVKKNPIYYYKVKAVYQGKSGRYSDWVSCRAAGGNVESIRITTKTKELWKGDKKSYKVKKSNAKVSNSVRWYSTNTKVATVSSKGVVKANKLGKCRIYVKAHNGKYASRAITVDDWEKGNLGGWYNSKEEVFAAFDKLAETDFDIASDYYEKGMINSATYRKYGHYGAVSVFETPYGWTGNWYIDGTDKIGTKTFLDYIKDGTIVLAPEGTYTTENDPTIEYADGEVIEEQ